MEKDFKNELYKFISFLSEGKNFAFVRLSDGENYFLNGNFPEKQNLEKYWSWKRDEKHLKMRERLLEASLCNEENFYVGLPTHGGKAFFNELKKYTKQKEEYLTYACLFMDSNYRYFVADMYPEFKNHEIIGVFNKNVKLKNLELNVSKMFEIGNAAYVNHLHVIDEIKKYILDNKIKNKLFLVTGGPLANILIYELFKLEKENTYIDIGSALDVYLGFGETRGFHTYKNSNPHFCVRQYHTWGGEKMIKL